MALKWDHSFTRTNVLTGRVERVREMSFQDHVSAQELKDIDGSFMHFHEVSGRQLATAKRSGREWICTRYEAYGKNAFYVAPNKGLAVDFMLGHPVPRAITL